MTSAVRTTCPYCGVGCGLTVESGGTLAGDREHPANYGRLCSKGAALIDTLGTEDRLCEPLIENRAASWDEALHLVGSAFQDALRVHGPQSVAFYLSGQLLTEDYYVANKLMKGFIGSSNIDTNSRLCMASSVAGHIRAFGEDIVPGTYEDFDETDLAILVGSNTAWCHPILYQRLVAARDKRGTRLVIIDPRQTSTSDTADLHLPIRAGMDVLLFNGLLAHLHARGKVDRAWIARHVTGFDDALAAAQASSRGIDKLAAALGIGEGLLQRFYDLFAGTERVMTLYSQGVNQSGTGTDKVNSIINCHLATARIGRPGMGPFSLTGQPNAMGGREVGGLANQLAAHMDFSNPEDIDRVRRFWKAPNLATGPGLKAVEMFKAIADGTIKAVWIAATNPAASMPGAGLVRDALKRCPFVAVSDCWSTETTDCADVILPAAGWAEKDGTVTNSERRISRQRSFRPAPGMARPDWWMFAEAGCRMGWQDAFSFKTAASIFREHAALSAFENAGARVFDIGALSELDDVTYDSLPPTQWPYPRGGTAQARLFADGGFPAPGARARMIATPTVMSEEMAAGSLRLNTGRTRDQWHTMTRTGRVPRLMAHASEPVLDVHPGDAASRELSNGGLARIESKFGQVVMRVRISDRQRQGEIFAPIHWTNRHVSAGSVAQLVTTRTDPISGQPDLKATEATVTPIAELWHGMLLHCSPIAPKWGNGVYWTKTSLATGTAVRLTGWAPLKDVIVSEERLRNLIAIAPGAGLVAYIDPAKSVFRYAGMEDGRLTACLFLAPSGVDLPRSDAISPLLGTTVDSPRRLNVLAGVTGQQPVDRMVCACFLVGEARLKSAIRSGKAGTLAEIGAALGAGMNCGSCIPELKDLLRTAAPGQALSSLVN